MNNPAANAQQKPIVVITGAKGNLGTALATALADTYEVVRCVRPGKKDCDVPMDISFDSSVKEAVQTIAARYGGHIAAVVHLSAYFDFAGEESSLYQSVNVEGTRRLVRELRTIEVDRFIYASTMLVHAPQERGQFVSEATPKAQVGLSEIQGGRRMGDRGRTWRHALHDPAAGGPL
jgi:nucleoside-diphosphate-sugar epimerase